ncbi:MAG: flagellar filament capping protein FliD, partial [Oscillospiraceae bacterium]
FGESNIAASTSISSPSLMSQGVQGGVSDFEAEDSTADLSSILNKQISITVNGVEKTIGLWGYNASGEKNDFTKASTVATQLNYELSKEFGSSAPTFSFDETTNSFSLVGSNTTDEITISSIEDTTGGSLKLLSALGFDETNNTNVLDTTAPIVGGIAEGVSYDIMFNDSTVVSLTNTTTLESLVADSNGNISYENGRLVFKGLDYEGSDDEAQAYLSSIFGENYSFPGVPPYPDPNAETSATFTGQNAIVTVNGATIANNSNSITIDGTTMDISLLSVGETNITVTTSNDSSKAVEAVKQFVEDYNALISDLYGQIRTEYDNDYQPLTEEQEEEMSDTEIEKWEAQAKTGLLYQDQTINKFLTQLRQAVSGTTVDGVGLYDMGITVSSNYLDFGKLEFDEAAFQTAIDEDPEKIRSFFTDSDNGFATRVTNVINSAVSTSGASKGTLTLLAGVANTTTATDNKISDQISTYEDLIETLQEKYEDEMERYWDKFTTLETLMSNYESQSSWLSSMLGTSS